MKSISILGKEVKIEVKDLGEKTEGEFCLETYTISISDKLKGEALQECLAHEIFHAFFDRLNLNQVINDDLEEIIVSNLAQFLVESFDLQILSQ